MVKYAAQELDAKTLAKVQAQLARSLHDLSMAETDAFLHDLLGPEEYSGIAKRLTAILLLQQGRTVGEVARVLHMSKGTVSQLNRRRRGGHFAAIEKHFATNSPGWNEVAEVAETILRVGGIMPLYGESAKQIYNGEHRRYREKYKQARAARRVFRSDKTTDINNL